MYYNKMCILQVLMMLSTIIIVKLPLLYVHSFSKTEPAIFSMRSLFSKHLSFRQDWWNRFYKFLSLFPLSMK